ncbi:uncharacterized protein LOC117584419 [Drosophila guanche]|uniref:uncharacterized protein LOC117584419 n=1 Tax=Drosophila guanche TaxID=7266 RepID=UPI00147150D7|nr:uncharacterized protein LOC117584419 [Drosophila guanche]
MKVFLCVFALVSCVFYVTHGQSLVKAICRQGTGSKCLKNDTYTWSKSMRKCRSVRLKSAPCGFFNILERCNEVCSRQSMSNDELSVFIQKYGE